MYSENHWNIKNLGCFFPKLKKEKKEKQALDDWKTVIFDLKFIRTEHFTQDEHLSNTAQPV